LSQWTAWRSHINRSAVLFVQEVLDELSVGLQTFKDIVECFRTGTPTMVWGCLQGFENIHNNYCLASRSSVSEERLATATLKNNLLHSHQIIFKFCEKCLK
jgi:hypothetical protein